jgi:hypothetical protein
MAEGEELESNVLSQHCEAFRVGSLRSRSAATHPIDSFGLLARVCHIGARRSRGHLKDEAEAERKAPTRSGSHAISPASPRAATARLAGGDQGHFQDLFPVGGLHFGMGILMLVQSCITLTKTIRDVQESAKLVNRIEAYGD